MVYSSYLVIALAVLALMLVGLGAAGYVVRRMAGKREWKPRGFVRFMLRYVAIFGLLLGLEVLVGWLFPSVHTVLRDGVAALVGGVLHLAGAEASVSGPLISVGSASTVFDITVACLGGLLFWVYMALVLAEPKAANKQRLNGVLIGLGILFVFNLSRIVLSVYLEGSTGLRVHDYFYAVNVVVVLLVWAGWVRTLRHRHTSSEALA